jgi:hypothetical protein
MSNTTSKVLFWVAVVVVLISLAIAVDWLLAPIGQKGYIIGKTMEFIKKSNPLRAK